MNIAILDDYQDDLRHLPSFGKLAGHSVKIWNDHTKDVDVLAERLKDTEALVLIRERTPIPAALIERLGKLRIVTMHGAAPNVDVDACTRRGVIFSSKSRDGEPSYATAELTWGLIIAAMRRIPQQCVSLKAGKWQSGLGTSLRGRTLGIFGYGKIGGVVAGYGKAFGMKVLVWAREASLQRARADGYATARSKQAFFEECDVIALFMRLVDATRGIVTAADLERMKPAALFVNTSRAGLVERGALEAALRKGRPGLAALDVFDEEPLTDTRHPLLIMDNVVATPHIGYVERDGYEAVFDEIFDNLVAYANGKPINVQNPAALAKAGA